jgi:hypothetical protein
MPKEWILNSAMNRFQLNFKRNVGLTSEAIRQRAPKNLAEWEAYYFAKVRSREHLENLGKKLYVKITEVIQQEVEDVSEEDCINYLRQLVINRTFDGYMTEIKTVYGQLEQFLNVKIEPAPDQWDRIYNIDFYIPISDRFIGIQIKPVSSGIQLPEIFKEKEIQANAHRLFSSKFGGKVFYVYSSKTGDKKIIKNPEVIGEIQAEIDRLNNA